MSIKAEQIAKEIKELRELRRQEDIEKQLNEIRIAQQEEMKKRLADAARAYQMEDAVSLGQQQVTLWEYAKHLGNEAVKLDNVMSFNDWRAAMMSLLSLYTALVKAIHHSFGAYEGIPHTKRVFEMTLRPAWDKIKRVIEEKCFIDPRTPLPTLVGEVSLDRDGKLQSSTTDERLKGLMLKATTLWLASRGYIPDATNPERFLDINGAALDVDTFQRLKADPDNGLEASFKKNFDSNLSVKKEESPIEPEPSEDAGRTLRP